MVCKGVRVTASQGYPKVVCLLITMIGWPRDGSNGVDLLGYQWPSYVHHISHNRVGIHSKQVGYKHNMKRRIWAEDGAEA